MNKPADTGPKPAPDTTGKPTPKKPDGGPGRMQPMTDAPPLNPKQK